MPGSPYMIEFQSSAPESSGMELMNASIYSCGDTSFGCSCGDCPSSPLCSNSEPPSPHKDVSCSLGIGSFKVGVDKMQIYPHFMVFFLKKKTFYDFIQDLCMIL